MKPRRLHASPSPGPYFKHPALEGPNSKFLKYLLWFEDIQGTLPVRTGNDVPLFPAVLPFPEASFVEEVSGDDQALLWWSKAFVNTFVAWGNFVVLGCPELGSSALTERMCSSSLRSCSARWLNSHQLS